ncbi:MAG: beta-lactamase family protein [Acidobacteria bacterium]|nr:beta-lactamase family protein [Acidobacteriota bacterium]
MSLVRRCFAIPALLFISALCAAQTRPAREINRDIAAKIPERMRHFVDEKAVAGVVTLVARDRDVIEFDAQGMADTEANHLMRKDTIFQIMSMTKPVTAIGIMMLAEEGKLSLRDPVDMYLPEFKDLKVAANNGPDGARLRQPDHAITIRDLLTHTAGMTDAAPAAIGDYQHAMNVPLGEVVNHLAKEQLLFQPGTAWSYSSAGIEILGRIIEVCSGQKYEDFIGDRILKPLGMKDSFFFPPADKVDRIAMVYVGKDGNLVRAPGDILGGDPAKHRAGSVFSAPGWGLYSTAEDLLHLYQMMLNDGTYANHRYLSPFSIHLMTESHTSDIRRKGWMRGSDYGLAWEVVTDPMGELAGHGLGSYGHGGAFGTQGWIDPTNRLITIMLIQRADGGTDTMTRVFLNMAESSLGK